jgi:protein-tyrosine phosphatase
MTLSSSNRNYLLDYNLTQITPFVFVSAKEPVQQIQQVLSNGIDCVINVACELPQMVFPAECGIESIKYPIEDVPNFPAVCYFDAIADRIADNVASNRRTLVYCHHGRSRSITFILAYLIKYHRLPLSVAFKLVQGQRQFALPNVGFWTQLKYYDLYQQEKNSKILQKIFDGIKRIFRPNPIIRFNRTPYRHSPPIRIF